ncbi:hypothetical protein A2160_03435 [Candidatus Beckwithbacteria bacterium RBG_13_42_9]|uniref:Uncharacterized protein n=1 Tax=Candidatus Beckwithbacteria bacterium RBG_13_42_9 TaxID=1797457 RepID=A0A1F5E8N2_9BACT|nr:MAG: hypothetical protein A2160_03435 [Candidatus Beckwithbacteria bacterium RBG_13_42_9]
MDIFKKLNLNPRIIEEVFSPFNGPIQVVESFGQKKIMAGGLIQSGGVLGNIWDKGLREVISCQLPVNSILILGLGGGTVAQLVAAHWPAANIIGIEIDPVMIQLGKKYFDLDKLLKLRIIEADAIKYVASCHEKFDLILIDLYRGEKVEPKSESPEFLKSLKSILATPGEVIVNRLFYEKHKELAQIFIGKAEVVFDKINLIRAWSNMLVFMSK